MKIAMAAIITGLSVLLTPGSASARRPPLIYDPTFHINGWKVICSGLETEKTYCLAEHRNSEPYIYLQFWPDRINVAASLNCTHDGYTPAITIKRGRRSMPALIKAVDEQLMGALKACANDPMHSEFRNELDDIQSLMIRTTKALGR